jgi:hypothetical protein
MMMYEGRVVVGEYEYVHGSGAGKSQNTVYKLDSTTRNRVYDLTYVLLYNISPYRFRPRRILQRCIHVVTPMVFREGPSHPAK